MANGTSFSGVHEKGTASQDILFNLSINYLAGDSVPFDFSPEISGEYFSIRKIPYHFSLFKIVC